MRSLIYWFMITLLLVFGSMFYIIKKYFTKDAIDLLLHANRKYLILSLLALAMYHTFDNLRLFVLSRAVGLKYNFGYGYVISLINTFGATITPAHVGGEFISFYTLMRKGGKLHKVMSVVTMKTLSGLSFFLLALPFAGYSLAQNPKKAVELLSLLALAFFLTGVAYLILRYFLKKKSESSSLKSKLKYTLKRYAVFMRIYLRDRKISLFLSVVSSVLLYISFLSIGSFLVLAFNEDVSFWEVLYTQLGLVYAIFMSPTPGGSGVGEVGALSVFASFVDPEVLGLFAILWRFISQYLSATLGGLFLVLLAWKDLILKRST
ncbi:flippase-like domain-containing protein [Thermocrinis minervae]|uniref:Lysylphosphatidylglycerol synthase TM region n=1 Tax=Thermocrinis minervae TaxID=381751 RepID=A0A1M6R2C6_9AQUI|nr:flippase-like domain-containing protein [Thermocrinis minervae]SHK26655.1 hypothetical protein SAMN05444391_0491 [Thermocrinis minervae]